MDDLDVLYVQAKATFHVVFFITRITRSDVDPEPAWIRIDFDRLDPDPDPGENDHKKRKKLRNVFIEELDF
jgi:hypothetical protein